MGNVASYPCSGVRCHTEDQIFILIFLGKYEYVSPKLNRMCFLTLIPVTNHSENKHITAWFLLICSNPLQWASYTILYPSQTKRPRKPVFLLSLSSYILSKNYMYISPGKHPLALLCQYESLG